MGQGSRSRFVKLAAALLFLLLASVAGLTGCGGFFTPVGTGGSTVGNGAETFVYVTNLGGSLAEYSLASGVLTALSGSPVTLPLAPYSIVVAPNNAFMYIGTGTGVFLYTINSDGTVTEGNGDNVAYVSPNIATGATLIAQSMVIDSTSSWLLIAYKNSTEIDVVQLDPTTGLPTGSTFTPQSSVATPSPQLAISPANTQVFVTLGAGGTEAIGFNASAAANTDPLSTTGINIPLHSKFAVDAGVAVDPTSTYLYIAEQNNNSSGTAIAGTVRLIATANLGVDLDDETVGVGPTAVLPDLSGAYAYVTNGNDGTISGFSLTPTTQKLASLGSAFPTEQSPVALVEDSTKTYVMDVGSLANPNLWLYTLDGTSGGALDVTATKSTASVNPSAANGIAVTH